MAKEASTAKPGRRTMTGVVVSDKMDKTVVVSIESTRKHPLYGRTMRRTTRYKAHDPQNQARLGDRVVISESRPISKDKRWRVTEIVHRGQVVDEVAEDVQA